MANTPPSLNNLDQAQREINDFINNDITEARKELNDLNNTNLNSISNTVDGLTQKFENLQNKVKNSFGIDTFNTFKDELDSVKRKILEISNTFENTVNAKSNVNEFVNSIGLISQALEEVNKKTNDLNNTTISSDKFDQLQSKVVDMKSLFNELVECVNFDNVTAENYQQVENQIRNFMEKISNVIGDTFDITKVLNDSVNESDLNDIMRVINTAFSTIPKEFKQNCSTAFNELQNNNDLKINIDDSNFRDFIQIYKETLQNGFDVAPFGNNAAEDALRDLINRQKTTINNNIDIAEQQRIDRIGQSQKQVGALDGDLNKIKDFSESMESTLTSLKDKIKNNELSDDEKVAMKKAGFDDETNIDDLIKQLLNIQKHTNRYAAVQNNIGTRIGKYKNAVKGGAKLAAGKELNKIMSESRGVASSLSDITKSINDLSKININSQIFSSLPKDMQDFYNGVMKVSGTGKDSIGEMLKLVETFQIKINDNLKKSLEESASQMVANGDHLNRLSDDSDDFISGLTKGLAKAQGILRGTDRALNTMGLGVGIPMSMYGFQRFIGGASEYYKEFGEMNYQTSRALYAQGTETIDDALLQKNINIGKDLYKNTYGKINEKDYSTLFDNLLMNVGAHNGSMHDKGQGVNDMAYLARTGVTLKTAFGVDSESTIKSLYKELNMSAKEVNDSLMNMVGSAQAANVPVKEYLQTITQLGVQFKSVGVGVREAENAIRNLTLSGMSLSVAQDVVGSIGNATGQLTKNYGRSGFYAMQANPGMFSNNFEASYKLIADKYDSMGNVREDGGKLALSALDTEMAYISRAWGSKGSYSNKLGLMDYLTKNIGIKNEGAAYALTEAYSNGDMKSFEELFTKTMKDGNKSQEQITREKLEKTIIDASSHIDELTKAQSMVKATQMDLAKINTGLYNLLGNTFQKLIATLGGIMLKLNNTIAQAIGRYEGMVGTAMSHPVLTAITGIAGYLGVKGISKQIIGKIGGKLGSQTLANMGKKAGVNILNQGVKKGAAKIGLKAGATALPFGIGAVLGGGWNLIESKMKGESWKEAFAKGGVGAASGAAAFIPVIGTAASIGLSVGTDLVGTNYIDKKFGTGYYAKDKKTVQGTNNNSNGKFDPYQAFGSNNSSFSNSYLDEVDMNVDQYTNMMYKYAGIDQNNFQPMPQVVSDDNVVGKLRSEQEQTKQGVNNLKHEHGILLQNKNSLAKETYSMQQSKYSTLIDGAKNELEQLKNIAKINDAGFTFLDKAMHAIHDKICDIITIIQMGGIGGGFYNEENPQTSNNNTDTTSSNTVRESAFNNATNNNTSNFDINKYNKTIEEATKGTGIDPNLVKALILQSSGGDNTAINGSKMGLMGVDINYAKSNGMSQSDLFDPEKNIKAGVDLLKTMKQMFMFNDDVSHIVNGYKHYGSKNDIDNLYKQKTLQGDYKTYADKILKTMEDIKNNKIKVSSVVISANPKSTTPTIQDSLSENEISTESITEQENFGNYSTPQINDSTGSNNSKVSSITKSPVRNYSSAYYTNNATDYDPHGFDPGKVGDTGYNVDAQGMARYLVQDYARAGEYSYDQTINSINNTSSSNNPKDYESRPSSKPNFNINIKVDNNNKDVNYEDMAEKIQNAVEGILKETMDSQTRIAESSYYRANEDM